MIPASVNAKSQLGNRKRKILSHANSLLITPDLFFIKWTSWHREEVHHAASPCDWLCRRGLILSVWGVFDLDYGVVGPGYCFSAFDKMPFFSQQPNQSKSLCMQIKNATIKMAQEHSGPLSLCDPLIWAS